MPVPVSRRTAVARILLVVAPVAIGCGSAAGEGATAAAADPYATVADSLIPDGPLGASIRRGQAIFLRTTDSLPAFAPGNIQCGSCHLDAGRRRGAAPLVGVHARYPKYMDRSDVVVPITDRINYCFTRSMAGRNLPADDPAMRDLVAYMAFLSTGVPHGTHVEGEGMPKLPRMEGDSARGAALYAAKCAACHGPDGAGVPKAFPALWGAKSYAIGASMAREERAAAFIRQFMPQNAPGTLEVQQAYDLARFINSQPRPDSPEKGSDWPAGGAPSDVPYDTKGHAAYRPPATLLPRAR